MTVLGNVDRLAGMKALLLLLLAAATSGLFCSCGIPGFQQPGNCFGPVPAQQTATHDAYNRKVLNLP